MCELALVGEVTVRRLVGVLVVGLLLLTGACVSVSQQGQQVRVTSSPEVVKGCVFLGNVKATSGWGTNTGLAASNTEKTLQNKAAKLGANVVFVVASGGHATGEAYRCK